MVLETIYIDYAIAFIALYITVFYLLVYFKNREGMASPASTGWEPSISVIIPAYNEEKTIGKCIESVLGSDYPKAKLEVIVVDDGSSDGTAAEAAKYSKQGVRVISKKNSGKANSMNHGIGQAKGEVIATLDADSFVSPHAIRMMLPLFEADDVVAVTAAVKVHEPRNFIEKLQSVEYIYTLFSRRILVFIESVNVTPGPFSMFRKWVFGKIGGFDPDNILEDQEMAMRIQSHNYRIRSSMDAEVFTEVPSSFGELLKQRTRWHRGGLRNSIKYLDLIGPKYGDLGVIVMPLGFLAVIAIFLVLGSVAYGYLTKPAYISLLGISGLMLQISPLHIIGAVLFVLTLVWVFWGLRHFKEKNDAIYVILYVVLYAYFITLFWLLAIYKEIKSERLSW
jgi:poly-beta-1,6-N-acetyl-D-glucosamine synthase